MTADYLDSSAFVKLVVEEPETDVLRTYLAGRGGRVVSSSLLRTEAIRAVRHLGPAAIAAARDGVRRVDLIAIDDRILDTAAVLEPSVVRTLDAIHLATALAVGDDLGVVITFDVRMADGARRLGLAVESPMPGDLQPGVGELEAAYVDAWDEARADRR
ncbi:MAG: type II toxin-antitoxin system VapC family toxin [Chloroflexota bacterium]